MLCTVNLTGWRQGPKRLMRDTPSSKIRYRGTTASLRIVCDRSGSTWTVHPVAIGAGPARSGSTGQNHCAEDLARLPRASGPSPARDGHAADGLPNLAALASIRLRALFILLVQARHAGEAP